MKGAWFVPCQLRLRCGHMQQPGLDPTFDLRLRTASGSFPSTARPLLGLTSARGRNPWEKSVDTTRERGMALAIVSAGSPLALARSRTCTSFCHVLGAWRRRRVG